jgi:hypothetical protein
MRGNNPVISTAKVRGLIKKNGISYVDATRRMHTSIAKGISVWQLCDTVLFQAYDYQNETRREEMLNKFIDILAVEGFTVTKFGNSYEIVKAVA